MKIKEKKKPRSEKTRKKNDIMLKTRKIKKTRKTRKKE